MSTQAPSKDFVIPITLDEKPVPTDFPLVYRPWGTRTLRLKITSHSELPKLWIRPARTRPEEDALGIYQGYADNSDSFHITWGGGHELGPCIKSKDRLSVIESCAPLQAGETSYLFFFISHAGKILPTEAVMTLRAFEMLDQKGNSVEQEYARFAVKIQPPTNLPLTEDILRLVPDGLNTWIVPDGCCLPVYDSRWWPASDVIYTPSERPPLILHAANGKLAVDWQEPGHTIAIIDDYTNPSALLLGESLAFELFDFDQWNIVLRISFFWTDKFVGNGSFIGRHEVPDIERFDLIIRRSDGRVLLAGTDMHWREVWARVLPNKILQATLGMPRSVAIQLAKEKWSETWNNIWAKSGHHDDRLPETEPFNNPVEPFIHLLAEREATVTLKASGTEAHVPTLHNVEQRRPAVMTSSDVRLG